MGTAKQLTDHAYADAVERLAKAHRKRDKRLVAIWSFPDPREREVRLLEVTKGVPFDGELVPFRFAPQPDLPFATVIILAHPDEWAEVLKKKIKLPRGWKLELKQEA